VQAALARSPTRPILPLPNLSTHHRPMLSSPSSYTNDLPRITSPQNAPKLLPSIIGGPSDAGLLSTATATAGSMNATLLNHQSLVAMGQKTPAASVGGPVAVAAGVATSSPTGTDDNLPSTAPKGKWDEMLKIMADGKDGFKGVFDVFFQRSDLFMEAFLSCLPGEAKERILIKHVRRQAPSFARPLFLS